METCKQDLLLQRSSELLPLPYSFGPFRVSSLWSYSFLWFWRFNAGWAWFLLLSRWPTIAGLQLVSKYFFLGWCLLPGSAGVQTQFSELRGYSIIMEKYWIGLQCHIAHGWGPCSFFGGWIMVRPLYRCCYDSRFSGSTIIQVCVFRGLGLSVVYCSPPLVLTSKQHLSCKIKK